MDRHKSKGNLKKVEMIYDRESQKAVILDFIDDYMDDYMLYMEYLRLMKDAGNNETIELMKDQLRIVSQFNMELFSNQIRFKHEAYAEEEEARIIMYTNNSKQFKISEQGVFIRYDTLDIVPEEDITGITIHPLSSDLHMEGLVQYLDAIYGDNHKIEVSKSEVPLREF
jgi:hypothetical protein